MHEQTKIREAKYFLSQMIALVNDRAAFNFNLSAFLAAARSALQYALKEAKSKHGGQTWYNNAVAKQPIAKFFKDKRDISIHANPVLPSATIGVTITESLHLSDSVSATITRLDGTMEEPLAETPPNPSAPRETEATLNYEYFFGDWSGKNDVISLAKSYIDQIELIVSDGVAQGFLSG